MIHGIICYDEPTFLIQLSGKEYKELFPHAKVKLEDKTTYYLPLCENHFRYVLYNNPEKFKGIINDLVFNEI